MLRLHLLRHAKSAWDDPRLTDHDRPLAPRGIRAAKAMARALAAEDFQVDRILCSTARRARETCELVLAGAGAHPEFTRDLYMASPREMLTLLQEEGGSAEGVVLVGHNPGMEDFTLALSGDGDPELLDRAAGKYPTGTLAEIRFDLDSWTEVEAGAGTLVRFLRPKDLPEAERERL